MSKNEYIDEIVELMKKLNEERYFIYIKSILEELTQ